MDTATQIQPSPEMPPKGPKKASSRPLPMPMLDAPQDGKPILLFGPEGMEVEVVWRHTRAWDTNGGLWRTVGFWALRNSGGAKIDFEPTGWIWVAN